MRVLITGASGFAGAHLGDVARSRGAHVTGVGRSSRGAAGGPQHLQADLTLAEAARDAVRAAAPERVFHLAAEASVARSWREPRAVLEANVASTLNVLEAVAAEAPNATVLLAGSGEIYGPVATERQPVTEAELPAPQNPYAVSKAACDLLGGFFTDARGVRVIRTRSFNHAGPGQSADYVVSSFARQIASAEHIGAAQVEVVTGSTAPRRDFTDVRDVVRAYWELGDGAAPGSYNVCSGRAVAIADILAGLAHHTGIDVRQRTDPSLVRAHEVMEIRGSHDKLTHATGWEPEIPLEQTLRDTLDWWRKELHA